MSIGRPTTIGARGAVAAGRAANPSSVAFSKVVRAVNGVGEAVTIGTGGVAGSGAGGVAARASWNCEGRTGQPSAGTVGAVPRSVGTKLPMSSVSLPRVGSHLAGTAPYG